MKKVILARTQEVLVTATQVAAQAGISIQTLNIWYKFKRDNPEHELAKMLPDYLVGERRTRYWKMSDVYKLVEFQTNLPKGRNGVMGDITQKYYRKDNKNDRQGTEQSN